jgi:type IV pilus assembly protein PilC
MKYYRYQISNVNGEIVDGSIPATDIDLAKKELLKKPGLTIIAINPENLFYSILRQFSLLIEKRITLKRKQIVYFTREISTFLKAGLSFVEALDSLAFYVKNKHFTSMTKDMIEKLKMGWSFSDCLGEYNRAFSSSYIASVKAGEASGKLAEILEDNGNMLDWEDTTLRKVLLVTTYPVLVLFLILVVSYILIFFLLPRIMGYLQRNESTVPFITRMLYSFRGFSIMYFPYMFRAFLVLIVFLVALSFYKKGRYFLDSLLLKLPIYGNIYHMYIILKFSKAFFVLYNSGVSMVPSLQICKNLFSGGVYEKEINDIIAKIENGDSLGESFEHSTFFPAMVSNMMKSGEKTGLLADKLSHLGNIYSSRMDYKIQFLLSFIEPSYIFILSSYILIIVFGFYVPMISVSIPK